MSKNRFTWTDERALAFARVASGGAYGRYKGAHSIESKLKIFKQITREQMEANEFQTTVKVDGDNIEIMVVDKNVYPNKRKDKTIEKEDGRVNWERVESEVDLLTWSLKVERK